MSTFSKAFYDRLAGDSTLTALLGTYNSSPSIFTKTPIPSGVTLEDHGPYILTTGQVSDTPGLTDTKNSVGREIIRDIRCYVSLSESPKVIEEIAERIRTLFHRQSISVVGFTVDVAEVSGPIEADEEDAFGRIVSVRLVMIGA